MGNQKRVHETHLWSERRRGFSRQCCEAQAKTLQNITQTLYTKSSNLLQADGGQNEGYFFFLARFQYTELEIETLIFFYIEFEMWRLGMNRTLSQCQSVRPQKSFCPLTASITMDVKNNYAYVTTQRILNKFFDIKFSKGCMVQP